MNTQLPFLALLMLALGTACHGTEVGNGRSNPQPNAEPTKNADSPADESGGESNNPESPSAETPEDPIEIEDHLFVDCASPLAELTSSVFTDSSAAQTLTITANATDWSVAFDASSVSGTKAITATAPYGIQSSEIAHTLVCESVQIESAKRTVSYSDGFQVIWTLDNANLVDTIEIYDEAGELQRSYLKQ